MKKINQNCDTNYHNAENYQPSYGEKSQPYQLDSQQSFSLIHDQVSLPAAVIQQSRIENNLEWMQRFAARHQVKLCPHGKTTMTPALFRQQLAHGAWGITVATPAQAQIAAQAGAKKVIIANQVVGKANMAIIANLIDSHEIEVFVCADSERNINALASFFAARELKLNILIEFGVAGGRCGCRNQEQVFELAQLIQRHSHLTLRGIEVYEGVIHGDNAEQAVRDFINKTIALCRELNRDNLVEHTPIVTGAGSAWYDVVSECLANLDDLEAIIRPGCYAIHDTGIYLDAQNKVMARADKNQGAACDLGGDLQSSLEVWAHVISKPEQGKLVVAMGKRDVAFDAGLPIPERAYRDGQAIELGKLVTTAVMDQHAFIQTEDGCPLDVGDIIAFSTSHPCLTFDKWRAIAVCDDQYQVTHWVETRF